MRPPASLAMGHVLEEIEPTGFVEAEFLFEFEGAVFADVAGDQIADVGFGDGSRS
jgi:hypothetical protein